MDLGIEGRRAAVAAASKGLGFATAAALVAEGARVAVCGRERQRIEEAAARLGEGVIPLVADVSTPEGARGFVASAGEALGGVDILVTNAGGPPAGSFESTPIEQYREALDLNLMSVVAMCHEAIPGMRAQGWGRVVAITSTSVREPIGNLILSNVARTGATSFLKTLAREVARDGVTVNSIQPGLHATDRVADLYGGDVERLAANVPVGFIGRPEDFGRVAAFLCSDHARYITGAAIPIDGGSYRGLL